MNAISKALDEIKNVIPQEILEIAFNTQAITPYSSPVSVDEKILNRVIRPRVLFDANMVGGQVMHVPIGDLVPEIFDNYTTVYHIPPERLMYRKIISVLSIAYMPYFGNYGPITSMAGNLTGSFNDLSVAGTRVGNSYASIPNLSSAVCELVADNTVLIRETTKITTNYILKCMVENDENLNNISIRSYRAFSKLCVLAVKAYLYKSLVVKLDKAYLQFGQELSSIKNYIDGLSDAEEQYQTHLKEVWSKVAKLNNRSEYNKIITSMINPGI